MDANHHKASLRAHLTYQQRGIIVAMRDSTYVRRTSSYKKRKVAAVKVTQLLPAKCTAAVEKNKTRSSRPRKLALLLPGHNEELIIATTIRSAIVAGQKREDIYVVDDASDDNTRRLAVELLGKQNVLTVKRSGKALAVLKAVKKFDIEQRYRWVHVADADSVFCPDYFRIYRKKLDHKKYAVAVGFVQSLRGNWISSYRSLTYTYSQHISRRIQSYLGMISVFPGPITSFRTDIIPQLDFTADSLTEDFDITLQVHRKKLGKIVFIPKAINYTQDPQTLKDFCKQNLRWQRGFFQGVKKYHIGINPQKIDISLGFQMSQTILFLLQLLFLIPFYIALTGNWMVIPVAIAIDYIVNTGIALWAAIITRRSALFGVMPYFYFLRWLEIGIHLMAFTEVVILRKYNKTIKGWTTKGRRYKLNTTALQDVAH